MLNFVCAKLLYESQPGLTSNQLLFNRYAISVVVVILLINKDLKSIMWDSVDRGSALTLVVTAIQFNVTSL